MYFAILIFLCITLASIEARTLPRAYHPLRKGSRQTIRLYPIQMRDAEEPSDNYSGGRKFNVVNDENLGEDIVHVTYPKKNNRVLDIVRQMAKNLKTLDQRTNVDSVDPEYNVRSPDSIENSKEMRNLFGSKGYVHLTYPSKQKNNMLSDIMTQLAKNLRILERTSAESAPLDYYLRAVNSKKDKDMFRDIEIELLNPHRNKKNLADSVNQVLKGLRMRGQAKSVEAGSLHHNRRSFDTIVHFEENPRRILDNDNREFEDITYEDLNDPRKEGLVLDVAKKLAKDVRAKDYEESLAAGEVERRANSAVTPKLVYEFNELVI